MPGTAGLNNPVTACLAVALAKAGAETMPKLKKTAFSLSPHHRMTAVFLKML